MRAGVRVAKQGVKKYLNVEVVSGHINVEVANLGAKIVNHVNAVVRRDVKGIAKDVKRRAKRAVKK